MKNTKPEFQAQCKCVNRNNRRFQITVQCLSGGKKVDHAGPISKSESDHNTSHWPQNKWEKYIPKLTPLTSLPTAPFPPTLMTPPTRLTPPNLSLSLDWRLKSHHSIRPHPHSSYQAHPTDQSIFFLSLLRLKSQVWRDQNWIGGCRIYLKWR